jgi:hypothetical protein
MHKRRRDRCNARPLKFIIYNYFPIKRYVTHAGKKSHWTIKEYISFSMGTS